MYKVILIIVITIFFSNCTIKTQDHGYDFDVNDFKKLKYSNTSKQEVRKIMGSPSAISSVDSNVWYYILLQTKNIAILKPKINKYKVLELKFNNNKLSDLVVYTDNKLRKLDFNKWESPVHGNNESLIHDFFYNIGRFNKASKKE